MTEIRAFFGSRCNDLRYHVLTVCSLPVLFRSRELKKRAKKMVAASWN